MKHSPGPPAIAEEELFAEIEQVLRDYEMMRIRLRYLAGAEEAYDFSNSKPRVVGGEETSRTERLAVTRADYRRCVEIVDAVMATMPWTLREFVKLRYMKELPMDDIADVLHCDRKTVYNYRAKALGRFATAFGWSRRHETFLRPVQVQGVLFGV